MNIKFPLNQKGAVEDNCTIKQSNSTGMVKNECQQKWTNDKDMALIKWLWMANGSVGP